jgi:hypothetical protein
MKQERLIKEIPKSKSHSKLNKWLKQATMSSEEHSWIENPITSTAATPEIASHYSWDQRCHYSWDPSCHLSWYSYARRNLSVI